MTVQQPQDMIVRKETVAVEIRSRTTIVRGDVFIRPHEGAERGERLIDLLTTRAFLPLKTPDHMLFLATRHIGWVRLDLLAAIDEIDADAESDPESCSARLAVMFADGEHIDGEVRYSMPPNRRRVGDWLETLRGFFPLRTDDWVYLVNPAGVAEVSLIEEKRP